MVETKGLWGIINDQGEFTVEPKFSDINRKNNAYHATLNGEKFWIDASGASIPEPVADKRDHRTILQCAGGLQLFASGDRWGIRDQGDVVVIPPVYRALSCFSEGVAWAALVGGKAWCPVGPDAKIRKKPDCMISYYPYSQTESDPEYFSDDAYENSVLWARAYLDYGSGKRDKLAVWVSRSAPRPDSGKSSFNSAFSDSFINSRLIYLLCGFFGLVSIWQVARLFRRNDNTKK